MNYYPFHIGDYLSATRHLSWEEDAAYRRLLDTYYTNEKPLPIEVRAVCRLVLATTEGQREAVKVVLEEFFDLTPDGWRNSRADAEIAEMQVKQQKQRDKANAMWEKRRAVTGTSTAPEHASAPALPQQGKSDAAASKLDADAMPPTPTPTPTPTPISIPLSSAAKLPTCPQIEIISLYHDILPELPEVRVLDSKPRQAALRKVWQWVLTSHRSDGERRATNSVEAIDWFRAYFERARNNDFLMGRGCRTGEHANWRCDFDFLLTDKGMKHVIEKTLEAA